MNKTFDSIAADTATIALNMMTTEELRTIINAAASKIVEKGERHRIAIEKAIADALEDGFDIGIWVEGKDGDCFIDHEDTNRITHISISQWETTNFFLTLCKIKCTYNLFNK